MADVNRLAGRSEESGDRGQLILVTGLAVAVTLVALVLLLNTVIYTQNLATRGAEVEDGQALAFRQEVAEGVGGLLDAENREEYEKRAWVEANVTEAVGRYGGLASRYAAERATVAEIRDRTLSLTDGVLLRQTNASRTFSAAGNDAPVDWTLAENVDASAGNAAGVRNFRMTVSGKNLSESRSDGFRVRLAEDADTAWRVFVYNGSGDDIVVAVDNATGSVETACSVSGPEATIDLTAGTVNGSACPQLAYATGIDAPYDVQFRNGDQTTGTYALTVRTPADAADPDVKKGNFAGPGEEASPRWAPAIYAAEFEIHFETARVTVHTSLRVAPGEPR